MISGRDAIALPEQYLAIALEKGEAVLKFEGENQ
jgi:hypothetical protein